jgi:hypothetical protein
MDLNNLIGDLLSQKMVFYGNMLGLGVEYRILGHTDGTSVITMNWDRCSHILPPSLQVSESSIIPECNR